MLAVTKFIILLACIAHPVTAAFVVWKHAVPMRAQTTTSTSSRRVALRLIPSTLEMSQQFSDVGDSSYSASLAQSSFVVADAMEIVKNVLVGVGGVVAVLFLVTFLLSSFIIPKAAEQIEAQAKSLDPALWQEYASKLEPGEVLAMRPDLMQELGQKVQALTMAKFDEMQEQAKNLPIEEKPPDSSRPSPPRSADVVDVEITSKKWDD